MDATAGQKQASEAAASEPAKGDQAYGDVNAQSIATLGDPKHVSSQPNIPEPYENQGHVKAIHIG